MYIDDKCVAVETLCKICIRTADSDEREAEATWLTGHGAPMWPGDKTAAPV